MPGPTRRGGAPPIPPPPAAELRRLYVDERRNHEDLGVRYHVSAWTVKRWLRAAGIRRRPATWAARVTATDLHALYVEQELTIAEIAARNKVSPTTVWQALQHHRIPRRPAARRASPPPEVAELRRLYEEGWSLRRLAGRYQVSYASVHQRLTRAGVPLRPRGAQGRRHRRESRRGCHQRRRLSAAGLAVVHRPGSTCW